MNLTRRMLIVDDEPGVLKALTRTLRHHFPDLHIQTCDDPLLALEQVRTGAFDLVLSDLRMPTLDGLSFLTLVSALSPHSLRLMLTATADFDSAQRAVNESGVFRYLTKPWTDEALCSHVAAALQAIGMAAASAK